MVPTKLLALGCLATLVISACASAEPEATIVSVTNTAEAPKSTATMALTLTSTATVVPTTNITIDGDDSDWKKYQFLVTGATTDVPSGAVDIVAVKAFNNDKYLYLAIIQQDASLIGKYAAVVRTDGDDIPDFYVGFRSGQSGANFGPFDAQSFTNAADVELAQGKIVEVKIPLELFGGLPVLYVHLQTEFNGPVADGVDFRPRLTDEIEPGGELASASGPTTSGLVATDETWSGDIHITGDITLAEGVTLTIEPGTTVYLATNSDDQHNGMEHFDEYISEHADPVGSQEWDQNAIVIDGRGGILHFVGTADEPIVFRPEGSSASSAQWDGIYIERGTIQYSKVLYAGRTAIQPLGFIGEEIEIAYNEVRFFHWAGIDSHTQNVWIHHNLVEGGGHQAITAASGNVVEHNVLLNSQSGVTVQANGTSIRNNIFINCVRGVQIGGQTPSGSEVQVVNNTFIQTADVPDGWSYQGELIYPAFENGGAIELYNAGVVLIAFNNLISGHFDWGIGLHAAPGSGSMVDYNLIWDTGAHFEGGSASFAGDHNLFVDPMLILDPDGFSYELAAGSPVMDAGSPDVTDADGSKADLGAFGGEFAGGW